LVWIETPSNPCWGSRHPAVCDAAHEVGALAAVDNTFLSPSGSSLYRWAPIRDALTTKYLNATAMWWGAR